MSKYTSAREKLKKGDVSEAETLAVKRKTDKRKAKDREHKRVIKALEREVLELEERQAFLDGLEEIGDPTPYRIKKARARKGRAALPNQATYFMLASDWHMGERVRPDHVQFKNEYNPDIAQERAEQFFRSQLTMLDVARGAWGITQGVFWLGGDFSTGYIHEEYMEENFLSPTGEAFLVYETLIRGIDLLLAQSDLEHIVIPTSNGNHGRTSQRIKIATYAKNSFERLMYQFLWRHYKDEPRLTFQIAEGYNNVVDVYGFRVNFEHGDAVRYGGGVGGLLVPLNRRIGRKAMGLPPDWEGTPLAPPHLYVLAHFHQSIFQNPFIVNGSLIGWNDFAERYGFPFEPPQQTSFLVDQNFRMVNNYNMIRVVK